KGQQYGPTGTPLTERGGAPLNFTREYFSAVDGSPNLLDNNEVTGIRVLKYGPRYGGFKSHEVFFRYSDAHLMKAEAMFRSSGDATAMVNDLRVLRSATPLGSLSEQDLIDERGRELYIEFWRRNDLIRFGQYTRDWEFKDPAAIGNSDRELFPIPATQIILNPNLVQNPGY
ncbi:RagB/SusD family nutrient uptake outer membrane protein, partial [Eudoraea sp.]|uniref:RagB/SusD family nutrient uptake outer membrane protein n=1 Tax=Eudoraea sp. TaxID=1979955 RepID=UPI003C732D46